MDFTTIGWLLFFSIFGYIVVGLAVGAVISNAVYKDGANITESRAVGSIAWALWPIALLVIIGAALWHFGIKPIITPRKYMAEKKAEKAARKAEGKPLTASYVD